MSEPNEGREEGRNAMNVWHAQETGGRAIDGRQAGEYERRGRAGQGRAKSARAERWRVGTPHGVQRQAGERRTSSCQRIATKGRQPPKPMKAGAPEGKRGMKYNRKGRTGR